MQFGSIRVWPDHLQEHEKQLEELTAQVESAPLPPLRWQQRVQIAQDILQALEFLHGLTPQMIHRQESHSDNHNTS